MLKKELQSLIDQADRDFASAGGGEIVKRVIEGLGVNLRSLPFEVAKRALVDAMQEADDHEDIHNLRRESLEELFGEHLETDIANAAEDEAA